MHTFAAPDLSPGHRTAICNAISAFLDSSLSSRDEELRQFVLSEATWFSVFDLLLDRYEDARLKPMRQLLLMLTRLLIGHPDKQVFQSIRSRVVCSVVQTIVLLQSRSHLKPALHVLEFFLQKGVVTPADVVEIGEKWLWAHHPSWAPSFREHCMILNVPLTSLVGAEATPSSVPAEDVRIYAAQIICLALLFSARNHDRSLTSGALFRQFCCSLTFPQPNHPNESIPFWVAPLKYVSLMSLDILDIFYSNHVLYPLFQSDPSHFHSFLNSLPFRRFQSGQGFGATDSETSLLFATLGAGKELGLIQQDRMYHQWNFGTFGALVSPRLIALSYVRRFASRERCGSRCVRLSSSSAPSEPEHPLISTFYAGLRSINNKTSFLRNAGAPQRVTSIHSCRD